MLCVHFSHRSRQDVRVPCRVGSINVGDFFPELPRIYIQRPNEGCRTIYSPPSSSVAQHRYQWSKWERHRKSFIMPFSFRVGKKNESRASSGAMYIYHIYTRQHPKYIYKSLLRVLHYAQFSIGSIWFKIFSSSGNISLLHSKSIRARKFRRIWDRETAISTGKCVCVYSRKF